RTIKNRFFARVRTQALSEAKGKPNRRIKFLLISFQNRFALRLITATKNTPCPAYSFFPVL
ncbi:MAG: hypothetical protein L6425_11785, partial [Candidatus Aminicenantes bacterium]|nr:hypothetical protein [Candidatus Aminicenantes bacterium]